MSSNLHHIGEFQFVDGETVETSELIDLYKSVGWAAYASKPELMAQLLTNSLYYRVARYKSKLVGLIRVVGDGVSIVYVQDLRVHPNYQDCGFGKSLLNHILEKYKEVRPVVSLTDGLESTRLSYEACGFRDANTCKLSAYIRCPW